MEISAAKQCSCTTFACKVEKYKSLRNAQALPVRRNSCGLNAC